jgi:hypothetical protein
MKATARRSRGTIVRLIFDAESPYDRLVLRELAREFRPAPRHGRGDVLAIATGLDGESKQRRVLRCLKVYGRPMRPAEISAATQIERRYVTACLSRLLAAGDVSRPTEGEYRLAQPLHEQPGARQR